jgi:hypothetical protein
MSRGMFSELTPQEAGRLENALYGALDAVDAARDSYGPVERDVLELIDDLRVQHPEVPPETQSFGLPGHGGAM